MIFNSHQSSSFGVYKETNNIKSKPNKDPNKDKNTFKLNLRIL